MSVYNASSKRTQPSASPPPRDNSFLSRAGSVVAMVTVVVLGLILLWYLSSVLLLIFAGLLLGVFLRGLSETIHRYTGLPYGWSVLVVVLGLLALTIWGLWMIAPGIAEQIDQLVQTIPTALAQLRADLSQYEWLQDLLEQTAPPSDIIGSPGDILSSLTGIFSTTFGALFNVFVILSIALYYAASPKQYGRGVLRLMPLRHRPRGRQVLHALHETLWWWLLGRIFSMILVGIMTGVGLWLLGVPLATTLGVIAAVLDFIPNIGPILAAIPGILLAFLDGPQQAVYVTLLYIVVQQVESYLITPLVQQETVELPPIVSLSAFVIFAVLLGGVGAVLAAPLTAVIFVLVKMVYVETTLGDYGNAEPDEYAGTPAADDVGHEQTTSHQSTADDGLRPSELEGSERDDKQTRDRTVIEA